MNYLFSYTTVFRNFSKFNKSVLNESRRGGKINKRRKLLKKDELKSLSGFETDEIFSSTTPLDKKVLKIFGLIEKGVVNEKKIINIISSNKANEIINNFEEVKILFSSEMSDEEFVEMLENNVDIFQDFIQRSEGLKQASLKAKGVRPSKSHAEKSHSNRMVQFSKFMRKYPGVLEPSNKEVLERVTDAILSGEKVPKDNLRSMKYRAPLERKKMCAEAVNQTKALINQVISEEEALEREIQKLEFIEPENSEMKHTAFKTRLGEGSLIDKLSKDEKENIKFIRGLEGGKRLTIEPFPKPQGFDEISKISKAGAEKTTQSSRKEDVSSTKEAFRYSVAGWAFMSIINDHNLREPIEEISKKMDKAFDYLDKLIDEQYPKEKFPVNNAMFRGVVKKHRDEHTYKMETGMQQEISVRKIRDNLISLYKLSISLPAYASEKALGLTADFAKARTKAYEEVYKDNREEMPLEGKALCRIREILLNLEDKSPKGIGALKKVYAREEYKNRYQKTGKESDFEEGFKEFYADSETKKYVDTQFYRLLGNLALAGLFISKIFNDLNEEKSFLNKFLKAYDIDELLEAFQGIRSDYDEGKSSLLVKAIKKIRDPSLGTLINLAPALIKSMKEVEWEPEIQKTVIKSIEIIQEIRKKADELEKILHPKPLKPPILRKTKKVLDSKILRLHQELQELMRELSSMSALGDALSALVEIQPEETELSYKSYLIGGIIKGFERASPVDQTNFLNELPVRLNDILGFAEPLALAIFKCIQSPTQKNLNTVEEMLTKIDHKQEVQEVLGELYDIYLGKPSELETVEEAIAVEQESSLLQLANDFVNTDDIGRIMIINLLPVRLELFLENSLDLSSAILDYLQDPESEKLEHVEAMTAFLGVQEIVNHVLDEIKDVIIK